MNEFTALLKSAENRDVYELSGAVEYREEVVREIYKIHQLLPDSCLRTFVLAVDLMDCVVDRFSTVKLTHEKLLAKGLVYLFIASKYEDVYALSLDNIVTVFKRAFEFKEHDPEYTIKEIEIKALRDVEFNINRSLFIDLLDYKTLDNSRQKLVYCVCLSTALCEMPPSFIFSVYCIAVEHLNNTFNWETCDLEFKQEIRQFVDNIIELYQDI